MSTAHCQSQDRWVVQLCTLSARNETTCGWEGRGLLPGWLRSSTEIMSHLFAKIKNNCHLLVFCCHVVSHYSFGRQLMHSLVNYFLIPVFCLSPECCCFPQVLTFVWIIACFKTVTPLHVQTKMEHPLLLLEYSKVSACWQ